MTKFDVKGNPNYVATVVVIDNLIPLEGCDNIQASIIQGNHVIISKDVKIGDVGIFFPVECSIKNTFLRPNNLYRDKMFNENPEKVGFFELNGRVRAVKLRGFASEGFWIQLSSLEKFASFQDIKDLGLKTLKGDITEFDHINDEMICEKYIINVKGESNQQKDTRDKFDKVIPGIFKLHIDTENLSKNIYKIYPNDIISVTEKIHGTSFVSSFILCNRKLSLVEIIFLRLRKWAKNE